MLTPPSMLTIKNRGAKGSRADFLKSCYAVVKFWSKDPAHGAGVVCPGGTGIVSAWLLITVFFSGCTPPGPKALLDGKRLIEEGKYSRAVEKLNRATLLISTNANAWNYLGLAFHYSGKANDAEKAYRKAISLNHDLSEAHYNLGCLCLAQNRPEKNEAAKTEFMAYTLRRGNSVDGFLKLGLAQLRLHELVGAERSFTDALRLNPQSAEALNGLGLVRLQRGRAEDAATYFRNALKQQPGYRPAMVNLGVTAQEYLKDRPLATRVWKEYASLKPVPEDAALARTIAAQLEAELNPVPPRPAPQNSNSSPAANAVRPLIVNSNVTRAAATNNARITNAPKSPQLQVSKQAPIEPIPPPMTFQTVKVSADPVIKPAQDHSDPPPATQQTETVSTATDNPVHSVQSLPSEPAHRSFLQRINPANLFRGNEKVTSTTPLPSPTGTETSLSQNNSSGKPISLVSAENTVSAKSNMISRYVYLSPPSAEPGKRSEAQPLFDQGVRAQQARRLADAMRAYTEATGKDPSFYEAWYNLGLTAAEAGNLPDSLNAYEHALAIRGDSLDARYNFALTLKQANYLTDAAVELEKVVSRFPNESRAHLALGNLYAQQLNQPAKARQHYLRVLETDPRNSQATAIRYWLTSNPDAKQDSSIK